MKILKTLFLTAILMLSLGFLNTTYSQIPTDGLVAYYPFNGNANDESGNGNNGTVNGAELTTDRFGNAGKAYFFNDSDKYISRDFNSTCGLFPTQGPYLISVWFMSSSTSVPYQVLISTHYQATGDGYSLDLAYDGVNTKLVFFVDNHQPNLYLFSAQTHLADGAWHHAIIVWDSDSTKMYLDGFLSGISGIATGTLGYLNQIPFEIGNSKHSNFLNYQFTGKLDDIRLYNRVLNNNEIQALYHEGGVNLSSGLVAYYPFNGNANDESGNGHNGIENDITYKTNKDGIINNAAYFNGSSAFLNIGTWFNYQEFTFSMWIKCDSLQNSLADIIDRNHAGNYNWVIQQNWSNLNEYYFLSFNNNIGYGNQFSLKPNQWDNLVCIKNIDSSKLFINGILIGETVNSKVIDYNPDQTSLFLGNNVSISGRAWKGTIDNLRFYNRTLNYNEIKTLYEASSKHIFAADTLIDKDQLVEVPISTDSLFESDNIISYQFNLAYDSARLQYAGNSLTGTIAEGGNLIVNTVSPGKLIVSYMNSNAIIGAGNILKLQFKALDYDTTHVNFSNFYFNAAPVIDIKNSTVIIADTVAPKANIKFNQVNGILRFGDTLLITATFTEPMRSNPLPQISLSGVVTVNADDMVMVNDSTFTYTYIIPKADGNVSITIGTGKDLYGNTVVSTPVTGKVFTILPLVYGDVDDNEQIMAYDAALALQYSVGKSPVDFPLPWTAWRIATANVDDIGDITANDAALILQYSADIISSFPVEDKKSTMVNEADVNITLENDTIVFRSSGELIGLNVFVKNNFLALGTPIVLNDNMIHVFNITSSKYAIGLATAYAPEENSIFMKIPLIKANVGVINFDMYINTDTKIKSINTATSIKLDETNGLIVYPNPVSDVLSVSIPANMSNVIISIFDAEGKLVITQQLESSKNLINVSSLSVGLYTLKISGEGNSYSQKFVKK